eukprot:gene7862-9227_t
MSNNNSTATAGASPTTTQIHQTAHRRQRIAAMNKRQVYPRSQNVFYWTAPAGFILAVVMAVILSRYNISSLVSQWIPLRGGGGGDPRKMYVEREIVHHLPVSMRLTIGVETVGGRYSVVLPDENDSYYSSRVFSTSVDNQESVAIRIYEGSQQTAQENKLLVQLDINDIPLAPRGVPRIHVEMTFDVDHRLVVKARLEGSDKHNKVEVVENVLDESQA